MLDKISEEPSSKQRDGWNKAKFLFKRRGSAFGAGKPDLVTLVRDVQRYAYLYGEDVLDSLHVPGLSKNNTQDIIELSRKQQQQQQQQVKKKEPSEAAKNAAEERATRRRIQKMIRQFYNERTRRLLYEESERLVSLSTTRVRQRLCDLMGTDVIRLNDKRYFQKLSQRLQEEYESVMDRQEEARAASEDERLRRLMLEGVIDAEDDYRAIVHGEHHKKPPTTKKKRRKIKRHPGREKSGDRHSQTRASDDELHTKSRKEEVVTQVGLMSSSRPSTSKSRKSRTPDDQKQITFKPEVENKENTRVVTNANEQHVRPPHHDTLRPSSTCSNYQKSRRVMSAAPRITKWEKEPSVSDESEADFDRKQQPYDTVSLPEPRKASKYSNHEPERVSKLRQAETVDGLYSIAEELVSPIRTDDQVDRKVKVVKQKKMT